MLNKLILYMFLLYYGEHINYYQYDEPVSYLSCFHLLFELLSREQVNNSALKGPLQSSVN